MGDERNLGPTDDVGRSAAADDVPFSDPVLRSLFDNEGRFDPETEPSVDPSEMVDLRARSLAAVADDRGLLGWARSQPTGRRVAVTIATVSLIAIAVYLWKPRADMGVHPFGRMALALSSFSVLTLGSLALILRPLQTAAPRWLSRWAAVGLGLGAAALLAGLPAAHDIDGWGSLPPDFFAVATMKCFAFGTVTAMPVLLAALLLNRVGSRSLERALLAGVASGLAGNLFLQVHCAVTMPTHLMLGHATIPVLIGSVVAGISLLRRRGRS